MPGRSGPAGANWEAVMSTRAPRTHNTGSPLHAGKPERSRGQTGKPRAIEWAAPSRASTELRTMRSSAPDPSPTITGSAGRRDPQRIPTHQRKPAFAFEWVGPGPTRVFSGPPSRVRCGGYERSRTEAKGEASASPPAEPDSSSIEPVWLFGRKTH